MATNNLPALPPELDNPNSIWLQPTFPNRTRPIEFTPQQLKNAIIKFSETTESLSKVLSKCKVNRNTFYDLLRDYSEIREFYNRARKIKSDKFGEALAKIWEDLPKNEEFYVYDRDGNKSLSSAAASYLRYKSETYNRLAQVHETGSYVPASKSETTNRNISFGVQIQGKLPEEFDLNSASLDQLVDALRGVKKC